MITSIEETLELRRRILSILINDHAEFNGKHPTLRNRIDQKLCQEFDDTLIGDVINRMIREGIVEYMRAQSIGYKLTQLAYKDYHNQIEAEKARLELKRLINDNNRKDLRGISQIDASRGLPKKKGGK